MGKIRLRVAGCSVAKMGRNRDENEDWLQENQAEGRFAVADGASTSARSEVWSKLLTESFVNGADPLTSENLTQLRNRWWNEVFHPSLPWFAQEKLLQGSAAAFVGLILTGNEYQVIAVGDSCLFHIRKNKIILAHPLDRSDQFSRFPALVSTRHDVKLPEANKEIHNIYQKGDIFVLATDAIAKYTLRRYEQLGHILPLYRRARDETSFTKFIARHRNLGLDNDDTTVCVVKT